MHKRLCDLNNTLPLGLIAGTVASSADLSPDVTGAMLIGVDLGPNLSVTGSLATILWLVAVCVLPHRRLDGAENRVPRATRISQDEPHGLD